VLLNYRLLARDMAASLFPRATPTLRLGSRRARFLAVFAVAFPVLWLSSMLGMCLDNVLYPRWKRTRVRAPVFIVGNFRTGSSFLLRLLASDRRTFTSMATWELYFGQSILQRRFWRGLFAVDALFGAPLRSFARTIQERRFAEVRLHRIRLEEPEEDEALFLLTWHSLFTRFFFPAVPPDFSCHRFDTALPAPLRKRLLAFYKGCLGRHLYARRSAARYLAKNPSATSRIASLLETFPDARFVYLYREPVEAVPSTLRWFSFAMHYFSSARERYLLREFVLEATMQWYRYPLELPDGTARRVLFLSYDDLVADPVATVERIYGWLGEHIDAGFAASLRRGAEEARLHRPDGVGDLEGTGFTEEGIAERYAEVADACRRAVRRALAEGNP
jgi:omega-hydroxy-beta-dihydromenaquinone-9 sulfotransferase